MALTLKTTGEESGVQALDQNTGPVLPGPNPADENEKWPPDQSLPEEKQLDRNVRYTLGQVGEDQSSEDADEEWILLKPAVSDKNSVGAEAGPAVPPDAEVPDLTKNNSLDPEGQAQVAREGTTYFQGFMDCFVALKRRVQVKEWFESEERKTDKGRERSGIKDATCDKQTSCEDVADASSTDHFRNVIPIKGSEWWRGIFFWQTDLDRILVLISHVLSQMSGSEPSTNSIAPDWKSKVEMFHQIIVVCSITSPSAWTNLEEFLHHTLVSLGKDVIVILANVEDGGEKKMEEKFRKRVQSNCDLILITQQEMDSINRTDNNSGKEGMSGKVARMKVDLQKSVAPPTGIWDQLMQQMRKPEKADIGIFSRSDDSDYSWLVTLLKSKDFSDQVVDVTPCYISNSGFQQFSDAVSRCSFGILYHTKNRGRINVTDVTDSLYDEELKHLHEKLGQDKVIVVIDDLEDSSDREKMRILQNQQSINIWACDVFLFSREEKNSLHTENLERKLQQLKLMIKDYSSRGPPQTKTMPTSTHGINPEGTEASTTCDPGKKETEDALDRTPLPNNDQ